MGFYAPANASSEMIAGMILAGEKPSSDELIKARDSEVVPFFRTQMGRQELTRKIQKSKLASSDFAVSLSDGTTLDFKSMGSYNLSPDDSSGKGKGSEMKRPILVEPTEGKEVQVDPPPAKRSRSQEVEEAKGVKQMDIRSINHHDMIRSFKSGL